VDGPPERTEDFRTTPLYAQLARRASAALHGAMGADEHL
jgi:NitT/TauT family transport system ATP-binding protein